MEKIFVKNGELKLVNGGYMVLNSVSETPVTNEDFIKAQKHAEYIVEFAKEAKGKDFVGKKVDNLEEIMFKVKRKLSEDQQKEYLATDSKPKMEITKKLEAEALEFIKFKDKSSTNEKMNSFLQAFNVIAEFEEFGLFFSKDIVKLNKIYTMGEIIAASKEVIDLV